VTRAERVGLRTVRIAGHRAMDTGRRTPGRVVAGTLGSHGGFHAEELPALQRIDR